MDWVRPYYDQTGAWWGAARISVDDRGRAATVERLSKQGRKHILELGASFGGTAAALADLGHDIVAVEISPIRIAYAHKLAEVQREGTITLVEGDFYTASLAQDCDVICYWNGFGIGSDADQRTLLRRVCTCLARDGCILMDVFNPPWWILSAGREERKTRSLVQRIDFDPVQCRLIDQWWHVEEPAKIITESIRCYTPTDLLLLIEGTGLALAAAEVAGKPLDFSGGEQFSRSPLHGTWKYTVKLVREG